MFGGNFGYNGIMELNYDENYWKQPCPKVDCHKKDCCCGPSYTEIPAALEDANPPKNGAHHNAIVKYAGSGRVYLYSKEGVPVLVKEGNA